MNLRRFTLVTLALTYGLSTVGCGYVFHPERRNQQVHSGQLDVSIVLLDAIGCLFFIIPGVIAFAVDISSNTIYLPGNAVKTSQNFSGQAPDGFVAIPCDCRNTASILAAIKLHTGLTVSADQVFVSEKAIEVSTLRLNHLPTTSVGCRPLSQVRWQTALARR